MRRISKIAQVFGMAAALWVEPAALSANEATSASEPSSRSALSLRESGEGRQRMFELEADGSWVRVESEAVCRETWEARCWKEERARGRMPPKEAERWVTEAQRLVQPAPAPAMPGSATLSLAIRAGQTVVGEAVLDAGSAAAKIFAPLWGLPPAKSMSQ